MEPAGKSFPTKAGANQGATLTFPLKKLFPLRLTIAPSYRCTERSKVTPVADSAPPLLSSFTRRL